MRVSGAKHHGGGGSAELARLSTGHLHIGLWEIFAFKQQWCIEGLRKPVADAVAKVHCCFVTLSAVVAPAVQGPVEVFASKVSTCTRKLFSSVSISELVLLNRLPSASRVSSRCVAP